MNKVDILTQITENTELMQAIERLVDVVDNTHDEFVQERMAEYHELRIINGGLVRIYEDASNKKENTCSCGAPTDTVWCWECLNNVDEYDHTLELQLHAIKERISKGGLL